MKQLKLLLHSDDEEYKTDQIRDAIRMCTLYELRQLATKLIIEVGWDANEPEEADVNEVIRIFQDPRIQNAFNDPTTRERSPFISQAYVGKFAQNTFHKDNSFLESNRCCMIFVLTGLVEHAKIFKECFLIMDCESDALCNISCIGNISCWTPKGGGSGTPYFTCLPNACGGAVYNNSSVKIASPVTDTNEDVGE